MLNFLFRELGGLAAMYNVATKGVPEPYKKPEVCSAAMKDFISQYVLPPHTHRIHTQMLIEYNF